MRVVVVGAPADRRALRPKLERAGIEVLGEFPSLDAAEASGLHGDAVVIADRVRSPIGPDAFHDPAEPPVLNVPLEPLTPREVQVLELLAEGLPNKGIADRLGISDQTVKFHVASIAGKLGAVNRTDAVRRAVRQGLITL
jgi:DNA-binding NarL/FixJ family response regulator